MKSVVVAQLNYLKPVLGTVYLGAKGKSVRWSPSAVPGSARVLIVEWKLVLTKLIPQLGIW